MIWFFIKKNFFDGWDNLISIILYNGIFLALTVLGFFSTGAAFGLNPVMGFASVFLFMFLFMVFVFAVNQTTAKYADYKAPGIKDTFLEIPSVWKDALLLTLYIGFLVIVATNVMPFYWHLGTLFGVFLASLIFWLLVVAVLALQWYFPIRAQLGNNFKKAMKKSFMLFFDNAGFSVFLFFYFIFLLVLSIIFMSIMPGISGFLLAYNNAFKLRLYKYDWLDAHPELNRRKAVKQIPWDELLAEDKEILGPRTLRGLLFPWKD